MTNEIKLYNPAQSGEIISPEKELVQCEKHGIFGCKECETVRSMFDHPNCRCEIDPIINETYNHAADALLYGLSAAFSIYEPGPVPIQTLLQSGPMRRPNETEEDFKKRASLEIGYDLARLE